MKKLEACSEISTEGQDAARALMLGRYTRWQGMVMRTINSIDSRQTGVGLFIIDP